MSCKMTITFLLVSVKPDFYLGGLKQAHQPSQEANTLHYSTAKKDGGVLLIFINQ